MPDFKGAEVGELRELPAGIAKAVEDAVRRLGGRSLRYTDVERYATMAYEQMEGVFIDPKVANDPELPTEAHLRGRVVYCIMEAMLDLLTMAEVTVTL